MKFRAGDVCEVVPARAAAIPYVGLIVTIAGHVLTTRKGLEFYTVQELSPHWFAHDELRLLRPPSWDSWITDTRDVERESKRPVLA